LSHDFLVVSHSRAVQLNFTAENAASVVRIYYQ
jgi:hypothetical protein